MFSNSIRIAFRSLLRHKGYSLLNIGGLAVGLTCGILVTLYVLFELSFDQYHANKDRIFRIATQVQGSTYGSIAKVNGPWGVAAKQEIPEIQEVVRFVKYGSVLVSHAEKRFIETDGLFVDPQVFSVFSWKLLSGDPATALKEPNSVVLTRELAQKYFGSTDAVGKVVTLDNMQAMKVTGVMENVPLNSHFTFTFLVSMSSLTNPDRDSWVRWNQFYTYLLLTSASDAPAVQSKLPGVLKEHMGAQADAYAPFLQPLTSIHLHSNLFREMEPNSNVTTVILMAMIGAFLLLIGCINFVNLTTARAAKRGKEVGIRKVAGANRLTLMRHFIGESLILTLIAVTIALMLAEVVLPLFNELARVKLSLGAGGWEFALAVALLALLVGVGAGWFPALMLSRFRPVEVLKGAWKVTTGARLRKALVILQFAISAFFFVAAGVVRNQLEFIKNTNPGFNEEQLVTIELRNSDLVAKSATMKNELLSDPNIVSVSSSAGQPGFDFGIPVQIEGVPADQVPPLRVLGVDQDFIHTYQMEMAQGRDFSQKLATDTLAYIINEEAARELGWADPLSHRIGMPVIGRPLAPVIGVVKDFYFRSMHEKIGPILLFISPPSWNSFLTVRLKSSHIDDGLRGLKTTWSKFNAQQPFTYTFFDEQFARLHSTERRTSQILDFFAGLAILLACLGLFGLAAFGAEQRTKEIGVRKVLGASVPSILGLLTREYVLLVVLANVLAWPIAYFAMTQWLQGFAYRIDIGFATFLFAGGIALLIALLTVSFHAIKAATANPVESLRYE
jgi:putative ABC transport system permease protein